MNRKELTEKAIELATIGNIMTRTCCVCRCIYDGKWYDKNDPDDKPGHNVNHNHGFCLSCYSKTKKELGKWLEQNKKGKE